MKYAFYSCAVACQHLRNESHATRTSHSRSPATHRPDVINSFQMNNGRAVACLTESDNIIYMSVTVMGAWKHKRVRCFGRALQILRRLETRVQRALEGRVGVWRGKAEVAGTAAESGREKWNAQTVLTESLPERTGQTSVDLMRLRQRQRDCPSKQMHATSCQICKFGGCTIEVFKYTEHRRQTLWGQCAGVRCKKKKAAWCKQCSDNWRHWCRLCIPLMNWISLTLTVHLNAKEHIRSSVYF